MTKPATPPPAQWPNQRAKVFTLELYGMIQTGVIMTCPGTGQRAFVDHGRVVWLTKEEAERILGHTSTEG